MTHIVVWDRTWEPPSSTTTLSIKFRVLASLRANGVVTLPTHAQKTWATYCALFIELHAAMAKYIVICVWQHFFNKPH